MLHVFSVTFKEINDIVFANLNIIIRMSKGRFAYKYPPFGEKEYAFCFRALCMYPMQQKRALKDIFQASVSPL